MAALGPWFPRWQALLSRLRIAAPTAPSARLLPSLGAPAETSGYCLLWGGRCAALLGCSEWVGGRGCPHPSQLRVSLCRQDHSTQLSRTGTLARKGIKSAAQAAGTLG